MTGYVRAELNSFQHKNQKIPHDSPYPWTQPIYQKNQILSEKAPSEELDKNNQKDSKKLLETSCVIIEPKSLQFLWH